MISSTIRRRARHLLAAAAVAALAAGATVVATPAVAAPVAGGGDEGVVAGAWIVTLKDGQSSDQVADAMAASTTAFRRTPTVTVMEVTWPAPSAPGPARAGCSAWLPVLGCTR